MTKEEVEKEFNEIEINSLWIFGMPLLSTFVWFHIVADIHWVNVLFQLNSIESSLRYLLSAILFLYVLCTVFIIRYGGLIERERYKQWKERVHKDFIDQLEPKRLEVVEITVLDESSEIIEVLNKEVEVRIKELRDGIFYERTLMTKVVKEPLLERPYLTYQEFKGFSKGDIRPHIPAGKYNMTLFIPE